MRYLFFIFPAYLLYVAATHHKAEWGFGFLWALEVIALQILLSIVFLAIIWIVAKNQLSVSRKICIYALLASALISVLP